MRIFVVLTALIAASGAALANDAVGYLKAGNVAWLQFRCAALATAINEQDKARLFKAGYENGQLFLYGWKTGKIADASGLAWSFQARLVNDMRPDFILGMVWEAAINDAFAYNKAVIGSREWKEAAKAAYSRENCGPSDMPL